MSGLGTGESYRIFGNSDTRGNSDTCVTIYAKFETQVLSLFFAERAIGKVSLKSYSLKRLILPFLKTDFTI